MFKIATLGLFSDGWIAAETSPIWARFGFGLGVYFEAQTSPNRTPSEHRMFSKRVALECARLAIALCCAAVIGQPAPTAPTAQQGVEFPVVMKQSVDAGKTPAGTKVQAKLVAATLLNGVVVPRDAVLSGEITESVAKTKTDPSRLALRMDTAQWKTGSAPLKVYLTAWYYPEVEMMGQDISYEPADAANSKQKWNGMGTYPDPNNPVSQSKFPGRDPGAEPGSGSPTPSSSISKHRVLMKHIESTRDKDGAVTLTSDHSTIKLDRLTTYVLSASDLLAKK
jgi:hypothetical protein